MHVSRLVACAFLSVGRIIVPTFSVVVLVTVHHLLLRWSADSKSECACVQAL